MKKITSIYLSIIMLISTLSAFGLSASAAPFVPSTDLTSGKCGENITYDFNSETGVLTLSGTGMMYDYSEPWRDNPVNPSPFCRDKNGVEIDRSLIKKVVIEDGITHIGAYAFNHRSGLTDVEMADSVLSIGAYAFTLSKLSSVSLSKNLVSIGYCAFSDNMWLEKIEIPETVRSIGTAAFQNCAIKEINIPEGIGEIAPYTFAGTLLKSVVVPDSVISIRKGAFGYCEELSEITLGKNVHYIERYAFEEDAMLCKVTINNSFIWIEDGVFQDTPVRDIYFAGTKAEWYEDIDNEKDKNREDARKGLEQTVIHCADGDIEFIKKNSINGAFIRKIEDKTYNGKAQTANIFVTTSPQGDIPEANWLKEGTDYSVSYKNNTKVGTATVKIKGKGRYEGTLTTTFKILPKGTKISKITANKKGFIAKWKQQQAQTTGYQLQYATDKKFTKNKKTITVKSNKTTSKTISNLSSKKKYYVRIRTYKTVDGKNYYSSWSDYKTVTTKK